MQTKTILAGWVSILMVNQFSQVSAQSAANPIPPAKVISSAKPQPKKPTTLGSARNIRNLYSTQNAPKQNYASMPEWWKREYRRRQFQERNIKWQSAREAQLFNQQMADPRSPLAMNAKRISALAHQNAQSVRPSNRKSNLVKTKNKNSEPVKSEKAGANSPTN